jgi:hypothetical protein
MNIEELKKEYASQDNRCTAYPIYVTVQELTCIGVMAEGFSPIGDDSEIIMEHSCDNCDKNCEGGCDEEKQTEEHCEEDLPMGYMWLDVEFFLTIKGAEEYMKANAHNHGKLRTYVKWFEDRNFEMRRLLTELGFRTK